MSNLFPVSNELKDDEQLSPFIRSSSKAYSAVIQHDGNFVLYDEINKKTLWSSGTAGKGKGPYRLAMQDGNLAVVDGSDTIQWSTNTQHKGIRPHRLVMGNGGHLRIYDGEGAVIWCVPDCSQWPAEQKMCNNDVIQAQATGSPLYCAGMKSFNYNTFQYDSLVVYNANDVNNPKNYLFNAGTVQKAGYVNYLCLNRNGNLGIFESQNNTSLEAWDLPVDTNAGPPFYLKINVDASLNVSLRVYGADINTGETVVAYSVYPPSS